jgi:glycerol-3-phosphate dehydrogenase (NAD(P)+)
LEGFKIDPSIALTSDLGEAMDGAQAVVVVVPSTAVRATCEAIVNLKPARPPDFWVLCSKGIEQGTLMPLHEVTIDVLGEAWRDRIGVLSGPSHAEEVARELPTTVTAAATRPEVAEAIQRLFHRPRFRVYTHDDVLGVELGAGLKNVIAIAAGVADGLGFGDNTRAALITRGLAEIVRLGVAMGARQETFMGLAGVGDLVVTATSRHSRNHCFGENLARGMTCKEALDEVGMVVEGYATAKSAHDLAKKHGVEMPIAEAVYSMIYDGLPVGEAMDRLLSREAGAELA